MNATNSNNKTGAVLVVGSGIGGIQAALDLAESGYRVYLVEQSPAIGGVMAQLDKTFPTNDCSMCILSPKLVECGRHTNITVMTNSQVEDVKGEAGNFQVTLARKARYIDVEKCTGCGECAKHCPVKAPNLFDEGLTRRSAVYVKYPQAIPRAYTIDRDKCLGCGLCEKVCVAKAVQYSEKDDFQTINVGSIILAPGFCHFDASLIPGYGYGKYPNVVSSIEFERMLSASGPFQGELLRPYDHKVPQKIAWIQCVGSRDPSHGKSYCSSVCCTYSIKEALVAKEHTPLPLETTIFFMDVRTFGKGFEGFYNRAQKEAGVRFVKCRPSVIEEVPGTHNLKIKYETEDGKLVDEEFDLVVLATGLVPPKDASALADRLGIKLNSYGFCQTDTFAPMATTTPGIYACGAFSGPKDIPETVAQASAAAASAAAFLSPARNTLVKKKEYPAERDVRGEPPRIGVFICHCGINIGGVVDVPEVAKFAATLPNVAYAEANLYTCSQDTQEKIKEQIKEHGLNRVVVASCTPRTHEPLFQETLREAGLNKYLFEMANIRDQCSWVHKEHPVEATEKAKDLVKMAVAKARLIESLSQAKIEVTHSAMVVGGGIAGMAAALNLADQGYQVYLIEKSSQLGGIATKIYHTLTGSDVQEYLAKLVARVREQPLIEVHTDSEIIDSSGHVGKFVTRIKDGAKGTVEIKHGVAIVATGGEEYRPDEYLYGQDPRVMTLMELEDDLNHGAAKLANASNVVIIQCVGSREEKRGYCSRICCSESLKEALEIKKLKPDTNVYVLYRDMRAYGFKEDYYQEARQQGIIFIRYELDNKPQVQLVTENDRKILRVSVTDPVLGERLTIDADILALGVATLPASDNKRLSQLFKVPLNEDGFFMEAHVKLRPVDFTTDGVFLCGLAHSPKFIDESIAQAEAAASRAGTILSRDFIEAGGAISSVNKIKCSGCGVCELICPYRAIEMDQKNKVAVINEALCKGCGACVSSCIRGAISIKGFSDAQILAMIDTL